MLLNANDARLSQMIRDEQKRRAKIISREQEEKLRERFPAIKDAYNKYQMLIKLHKDHN